MARHGGISPVSLQFSVQYAVPKGRRRPRMSKQVIEEAIRYWIEYGEDPAGMVITPISWQHGNSVTEADDPERFRIVLGRLLQAGAHIAFKMGSDERV